MKLGVEIRYVLSRKTYGHDFRVCWLTKILGVPGFTIFEGKTKFDLHLHLGTPRRATGKD